MASSATFSPFADSRWAISSAIRAPEGVTDQGVKTLWLQIRDGIDMKFGHIFDAFQRLVKAFNALRLQSVDRKIRFNVLDRLKEIDDAATQTVCQKNRRLSSPPSARQVRGTSVWWTPPEAQPELR